MWTGNSARLRKKRDDQKTLRKKEGQRKVDKGVTSKKRVDVKSLKI